jgi:hypothetical protein
MVHPDALLAQRLGERVMFFLRLLRPHHVVEQQRADVLRGEPGQLQAEPVNDDLTELSHLRVDAEGHDCAPWLAACSALAVPAWPAGLVPAPRPWPAAVYRAGAAAAVAYGLPAG